MKVLIAEDEAITRSVLEANLREWGYEVTAVSNGSEALEIVQQPESPSIVITDWMMPRMDGLTLCRKIRDMEKSQYIYIIILTAKGEKKDIIEGLEAGADDYLSKPFNRDELRYRTRIGERIINLERRIMELANTDPLTGLPNRRAFMHRMEEELDRARREKFPLSVVLADVDHFKDINDTYGHQIGDLVLQQFVGQLKTSARPYDFPGRYGGEEFLFCFPGVDDVQAVSVAERMRGRIEDMEIMLGDEARSIRITASFGTASYSSGTGENIDSLIKRADDALYLAKKRGRNRVCNSGEEPVT